MFTLCLAAQVEGKDQLMQFSELQALLCGSLQIALRSLHADDVRRIADVVMGVLLALLQTVSGKTSGVQSDVLMATTVLVEGRRCVVVCWWCPRGGASKGCVVCPYGSSQTD